MSKFNFFWETMNKCDWSIEGDCEKKLKPLVDYLSSLDDIKIFEFDSLMTKLLYELDSRKLFEKYEKNSSNSSDDGFLFARCFALINGEKYYNQVKSGDNEEVWELDFESILYVPKDAWSQKHNKDSNKYPCRSFISYKTGSNSELWGNEEKVSNQLKLKIFDRASWQIDGGEDEDEIIKKFTQIFTFLKEHDMLNEQGLEFLDDGIDDSISLSDNFVNKKGSNFLKKYYNKVIGCSSKSIKKALKDLFFGAKYSDLIDRLGAALRAREPMNYHVISFIKGATIKGSKLGGVPYLPVGGSIPMNANNEPLIMIAQVNLSELSNSLLPQKEGILQFWISHDENYGADFENPCSNKNSCVIYYPTIEKYLSKKVVLELFSSINLNKNLMFPLTNPLNSDYKLKINQSDTTRVCINDFGFSECIVDKYNELYPDEVISNVFEDIINPAKKFTESKLKTLLFMKLKYECDGKLLGYPDFIKDDPRKNGFPELHEYILLFQLSSKKLKDCKLDWGKNGIARWFIHPNDLEKGDFSKVWYSWDC